MSVIHKSKPKHNVHIIYAICNHIIYSMYTVCNFTQNWKTVSFYTKLENWISNFPSQFLLVTVHTKYADEQSIKPGVSLYLYDT